MKELLKPKNDVVFHCLFRKGNEAITKSLISSIIGKEIKKIELNNDRFLLQKYPNQKGGILDLNATLDDGILCNIEIQLADKGYTEKRFLYYWSRNYGGQLVKGDAYGILNKTISILIIDFELEKLKDIVEPHTKWQIREEKYSHKLLTDDLEIHIIELPKSIKMFERNENNKLLQWMMFLDNPNNKGVLDIMKKNENIADALWKLEEISEDKKLRRIAELEEKWKRDEISAQLYWKETGLEEGRKEGRKKGRQEGRREGRQEGRQEGITEGSKKQKIKTAKEMIKDGLSIENIIKYTELTEQEIETLIKEINVND